MTDAVAAIARFRSEVERDVRSLDHDIATHRVIVSPDIKRIVQASLRLLDHAREP